MEPFFINPNKKFSIIEISRLIKLAHTSVKNNLEKLVEEKLIIKTEKKQNTRIFPLYHADFNNKKFRNHKIIYNLQSLLNSNIIEYLEDELMPKTIILFGSYQKGEDQKESDIDLFIKCEKEIIDLKKFEEKLHRKIQLHFRKSFKNYSKELKNNISNGIVISGFLEIFK